MSETELSLADTTPAEEIRDVTPENAMTPEGFDLQAWLAGARPSRRATTIFARPDLLADIDVLSERVIVARSAGTQAEVAGLLAQIRDIREAVAASSLDIVVEARSAQVQDDLRASLGIVEGQEPTTEQTIAFIAAHIVEPEGFDAAALSRFNEVSPQQVVKIAQAVRVANDSAPVIPAPFSQGPSSAPSTRG